MKVIDGLNKVMFRIVAMSCAWPRRRLRRHGLHRGRYGLKSLIPLGRLIACFYFTRPCSWWSSSAPCCCGPA